MPTRPPRGLGSGPQVKQVAGDQDEAGAFPACRGSGRGPEDAQAVAAVAWGWRPEVGDDHGSSTHLDSDGEDVGPGAGGGRRGRGGGLGGAGGPCPSILPGPWRVPRPQRDTGDQGRGRRSGGLAGGPPCAGSAPAGPRRSAPRSRGGWPSMSDDGGAAIEDFYLEERLFPPPEGFVDQAVVADPSICERAERDVEAFWAEQARAPRVVRGVAHRPRVGPALRPLVRGRDAERVVQLPRPPRRGRPRRPGGVPLGKASRATRGRITYAELLAEVRALRQRPQGRSGSDAGDRVAIYMPMIPELPVAMLACTRIGAAHSVVFGGFSPDALRDRINDAAGQGAHHRRRRVAAGRGRGAEGERRHGRGRHALDRARGGGPPHGRRRRTTAHDRGTRPLVGRR